MPARCRILRILGVPYLSNIRLHILIASAEVSPVVFSTKSLRDPSSYMFKSFSLVGVLAKSMAMVCHGSFAMLVGRSGSVLVRLLLHWLAIHPNDRSSH